MEDNFSTDGGVVRMVQAVMQAMGNDGEQQMKLRLLAHPHSVSELEAHSCCEARFLTGRGLARGLGTPDLDDSGPMEDCLPG